MFTRASMLLLILSRAATAQTLESKWDTLKMLTPGTEVRVASANAKPIQGSLESVTDNDLVLRQAGGQTSLGRAQILSVSVKGKDHRLRNAMIGLGVGTAAGLSIGYGIGHAQANHCSNKGGWFCGLDEGVGTVVGGVAGILGGTLTGVFWHTGGWRKVYAV
jgi:hypothetical protein